MGGKKRGAPRQRKRADLAASALTGGAAAFDSRLRSKPDSDLFVLDTAPDATGTGSLCGLSRRERRILEREAKEKKKEGSAGGSRKGMRGLSEKDRRKVDKLVRNLGGDGGDKLSSMAQESREKSTGGARSSKRKAGTTFDLWGEDDGEKAGGVETATLIEGKRLKVVAARPDLSGLVAGALPVDVVPRDEAEAGRAAVRAKMTDEVEPAPPSNRRRKAREAARRVDSRRAVVAVDVAHSGQSYRPDPESHQNVLGEALSIELRREEAVRERDAPPGGGTMSEETLAVLVGDDDDEDEDDGVSSSSSEDEDEGGDARRPFRPKKRREKLTRAQRNRRKRARQLEVQLVLRKRERRLLHAVNEAGRLKREVDREERERAARREVLRKLREEKLSRPLGKDVHGTLAEWDPVNVPTLPVALTSELAGVGEGGEGGGTLRAVRPKGNLVTERMESFAARKMANKKKPSRRNVVEGKKRMKPGKGRDYLLM